MKAVPPVTAIARTGTVRLISTAYLQEPALAPLADSPEQLDELAELESATNQRLLAEQNGLLDLDARELVYGRAGYSYINAAFTHTRPSGNRFNDEHRGAWYCAFEVETSLAEVTFHLTRELRAIDRFDNVSYYAELLADFHGPFHDLRPDPEAHRDLLDPDIETGYPKGQQAARTLRLEHASNGIVYPSVRHEGGTCLACFRPDMVQNLRAGGLDHRIG